MRGIIGLSVEVIEVNCGKRWRRREFSFFRLDGSQGVWGFRGIVGRGPVQGGRDNYSCDESLPLVTLLHYVHLVHSCVL